MGWSCPKTGNWKNIRILQFILKNMNNFRASENEIQGLKQKKDIKVEWGKEARR